MSNLIILLCTLTQEGRSNMAAVYVTLIINGKKKFSQVPSRLKEEVKQMLIDLDLERLTAE